MSETVNPNISVSKNVDTLPEPAAKVRLPPAWQKTCEKFGLSQEEAERRLNLMPRAPKRVRLELLQELVREQREAVRNHHAASAAKIEYTKQDALQRKALDSVRGPQDVRDAGTQKRIATDENAGPVLPPLQTQAAPRHVVESAKRKALSVGEPLVLVLLAHKAVADAVATATTNNNGGAQQASLAAQPLQTQVTSRSTPATQASVDTAADQIAQNVETAWRDTGLNPLQGNRNFWKQLMLWTREQFAERLEIEMRMHQVEASLKNVEAMAAQTNVEVVKGEVAVERAVSMLNIGSAAVNFKEQQTAQPRKSLFAVKNFPGDADQVDQVFSDRTAMGPAQDMARRHYIDMLGGNSDRNHSMLQLEDKYLGESGIKQMYSLPDEKIRSLHTAANRNAADLGQGGIITRYFDATPGQGEKLGRYCITDREVQWLESVGRHDDAKHARRVQERMHVMYAEDLPGKLSIYDHDLVALRDAERKAWKQSNDFQNQGRSEEASRAAAFARHTSLCAQEIQERRDTTFKVTQDLASQMLLTTQGTSEYARQLSMLSATIKSEEAKIHANKANDPLMKARQDVAKEVHLNNLRSYQILSRLQASYRGSNVNENFFSQQASQTPAADAPGEAINGRTMHFKTGTAQSRYNAWSAEASGGDASAQRQLDMLKAYSPRFQNELLELVSVTLGGPRAASNIAQQPVTLAEMQARRQPIVDKLKELKSVNRNAMAAHLKTWKQERQASLQYAADPAVKQKTEAEIAQIDILDKFWRGNDTPFLDSAVSGDTKRAKTPLIPRFSQAKGPNVAHIDKEMQQLAKRPTAQPAQAGDTNAPVQSDPLGPAPAAPLHQDAAFQRTTPYANGAEETQRLTEEFNAHDAAMGSFSLDPLDRRLQAANDGLQAFGQAANSIVGVGSSTLQQAVGDTEALAGDTARSVAAGSNVSVDVILAFLKVLNDSMNKPRPF